MTSCLLHIDLNCQSCGQRFGCHYCGLPKVIMAIAAVAVLVAIVTLKPGIFSRGAAVRTFACILVRSRLSTRKRNLVKVAQPEPMLL